MTGTVELPPVIRKPKKSTRYPEYGLGDEGKERCPYCLETLSLVEAEPSPFRLCPICQHAIPLTIRGTAPHCFNRSQKWDLLANEMEYIWNWGYCDANSYVDTMAGFYNPDFSDAKDRLVEWLQDKDAVLRLREEFMEAEGDLDLLIIGYLRKRRIGRGTLGDKILEGRPWRLKVLELSLLGAVGRPIAEFQLEYIRSLSWAVFGSLERRERAIAFLEERLEKLNENPLGDQQAG